MREAAVYMNLREMMGQEVARLYFSNDSIQNIEFHNEGLTLEMVVQWFSSFGMLQYMMAYGYMPCEYPGQSQNIDPNINR